MALEDAMTMVDRLLTSADALGAVTARLRLVDLEGETDPALRAQLDRVADVLGARDAFDGLDHHDRAVVVSFARSYLRQTLDLLEDPLREPGWTYTDPVLLQAQGDASAGVAKLFHAAGLGGPGLRILDVGTGVAGLAIAFCRTYPDATVVGLDPWEPALEIARRNVEKAGLGDRIALVASTIEAYDDAEAFDLAWLPSFFIPEHILDDAIARIHDLLRSGGKIVVATGAGEEGTIETAIDDLRNIRSGGSVLSGADALSHLERKGFIQIEEPEFQREVPLRFAVGTRT